MTTATILSWVLAAAPGPSTPTDKTPPRNIESVELDRSEDTVQITARDSEGEVSAEIVVWGREGEVRFDALFPDGLYLSVVTDGETVTVDSDDPQEAAVRVGEIHDFLMQTEPQEGPAQCGGAVAMGIAHAVAGSPWVIVEAVFAACECLPLLVDEWEGYHCPLFG
jgi:hypothetical protein